MKRLVIVADDLTGAADAAAAYGPFADVAVILDPAGGLPRADVVAVDTDSRHSGSQWAARAVTTAVRAAADPETTLYKKIDSTLRGNIAAELAAALRELSVGALVAPAFPDTGRTVAGGVLRVDGVVHGDLQELFAGSGLSTALIPLAVVRRGASAVAAAYREHRAQGAVVVCADAVIDADLEAVNTATSRLDSDVLLVGSAGLTRVAARGRLARERVVLPRPAGPVLTVLGSYSAVAGQQRAALMVAGLTVVSLDSPFGPDEQQSAAAELAAASGDVLLVPDPTARVEPERAAKVAAALAAATETFLRERHNDLAGLILTGGETGRAVLLGAEVSRLTVLGELEPGVVRSLVPSLGNLPLITKAGAFGTADTLENARRALHERERPH